MGIVDACIHPLPRSDDELRRHMPEAWRRRLWPGPDRVVYQNPRDDYLEGSRPSEGPPGSDPGLVQEWLEEHDVDCGVLLPLTRGLQHDPGLGSMICRATNDWLAETWLDGAGGDGRLRGSIRVNPEDPRHAVEEIERWAAHPGMVQVAIPLQASNYYGKHQYQDIWAAAAQHGLPVALQADWAPGMEYAPSPIGYFRDFAEFSSFYSCNFFYHLCSLMVEGVFDRLESLKVVFGDGGSDVLGSLIWRADAQWRSTRDEHPWMSSLPSSYLDAHVRFVSSAMEGPEAGERTPGWLEMIEGERLLVYGSHYPHWPSATPREIAPPEVSGEVRRRILGDNARALYGLSAETPAPTVA
jgi:predicted TIM-barrel fold metal-dependent hydrolase